MLMQKLSLEIVSKADFRELFENYVPKDSLQRAIILSLLSEEFC